jgi:prolyl-tRNA synthetase
MQKSELGITVKKTDDMAEWYSQVVTKSEVADYAPVRGCMVIRPYGYSLWQTIVDFLDARIKKRGVENAYFPLFIPENFFSREAEHAEGFKAEVAWIENKDDEGERLAIRPTSETIIYDSYSRWLRSWRQLPMRINQWCNIVRWEVKDVKMFLRSREFLWQEGHCVYENEKECHKETLQFLEEYRKVMEDLLAVPVMVGEKTERERFAGAIRTYTIEGFMPDGKALQLGTSHDLSQGFAKAFQINFEGRDGKMHMPFQNSWGLSTRTIGAVILQHGDDKGLVLPPALAPIKVVIVPIIFKEKKDEILAKCRAVAKTLRTTVKVDDREEYSSGWKFNEWELKGVPIRLELGPRDMEHDQVMMVRRDTGEKKPIPIKDLPQVIKKTLSEIQEQMFNKAKKQMEESTMEAKNWDEFKSFIEARRLVKAHFCGEVACEEEIKTDTGGATSRCIPLNSKKPENVLCVHCGKPARHIVYFAKNY